LWGNACFYLENLRNVLRWRPGQYALKKNSIRHFLARWPIKRTQHGEAYRYCGNVLILRSDIYTGFARLHLPTRAPGTSEPSTPWLNNRTCRSIMLPSSTNASWQASQLVRITGFLCILTTRKVREIYLNAVIQRAPLRYLFLRQSIPVRRHRPVHQIEGYALRSEERSTVIAVCAWWFYRQFRCEG
jgi:hypothetical protein